VPSFFLPRSHRVREFLVRLNRAKIFPQPPVYRFAVLAMVHLPMAVRTDRADPARVVRAAVRYPPDVMRLQVGRAVRSAEGGFPTA
jgi:hypothetical protein